MQPLSDYFAYLLDIIISITSSRAVTRHVLMEVLNTRRVQFSWYWDDCLSNSVFSFLLNVAKDSRLMGKSLTSFTESLLLIVTDCMLVWLSRRWLAAAAHWADSTTFVAIVTAAELCLAVHSRHQELCVMSVLTLRKLRITRYSLTNRKLYIRFIAAQSERIRGFFKNDMHYINSRFTYLLTYIRRCVCVCVFVCLLITHEQDGQLPPNFYGSFGAPQGLF